MQLLNTLGINGWILLWQVIIFLLLLGLLRKFAYGPILSALEAREKRLASGLKDAEKATADAASAATEKEATLRKAMQEAERVMGEARAAAEKLRAEKETEAKQSVEKILADGRSRLAMEKEAMLKGVEGELAEVVSQAASRVIGRTLTDKDHERLVKEATEVLGQAAV